MLADDNAIQGTRVLANSSAVGDFCVRIYDADRDRRPAADLSDRGEPHQ